VFCAQFGGILGGPMKFAGGEPWIGHID
jgi:hypothetical protein